MVINLTDTNGYARSVEGYIYTLLCPLTLKNTTSSLTKHIIAGQFTLLVCQRGSSKKILKVR